MESILANAFGRSIDIQGGEADELTKVAQTFFEQSEEGKLVSRDMMVMMASKFTLNFFLAIIISKCYYVLHR